jgi:hypothetical protein
MAAVREVGFVYEYEIRGVPKRLEVQLQVPYEGKIKELVHRVMKQNSCPCYHENDLSQKLCSFISQQTNDHMNTFSDNIITRALDDKNIDKGISQWVNKYTNNHAHFTTIKEATEDPFPSLYHQLIHSPILSTLLQLEHAYTMDMSDICSAGKNAISMIQKKHDAELEETMKSLGTRLTDADVNKLMRQHITDRKNLEDKWAREIKKKQELQWKEYRDWLSRLHEEINDNKKDKSKKTVLSELQRMHGNPVYDDGELSHSQPIMEESFTIHLGSQQKSSHNLRLLCDEVFYFFSESGDANNQVAKRRMNPRRIEMSMSLYTNDLKAIILMAERELNTVSGIKEMFADICGSSTDFHFPSFDIQLSKIQESVLQLKLHRNVSSTSLKNGDNLETGSLPYKGNSSGDLLNPVQPANVRSRSPSPTQEEEGVTMEPGDFYITCHSNLAQVQVVCHLVSEDKAVLSGSLSNRHPIMQGLRNVLYTLSKHGLHHVVVPLLLTNQMKPEMTINWCLKRAELVFKSIKGFLLESTTWKGNKPWTVEFLLPKGISGELFEQISELLSKTFRTSVSRTLS